MWFALALAAALTQAGQFAVVKGRARSLSPLVIIFWTQSLGLTVWALADKDSQWFSPSDSAFMINYRVDDLDALLAQLRAANIEVVGGPESHENGKFAWIMDPDGNKVELWEPMLWDARNKSP